MAWLNVGSVGVYIFSIILNRRGAHFSSSIIMVLEILLHQLVAVWYFGPNAAFQNYVLVIGLFPFLMPKGRWGLKFLLLGACFGTYLWFIYTGENLQVHYALSQGQREYLRISNTLFAFISLAVSGGYLTLAMHETEDDLEERSEELRREKDVSEALILNILPREVADDLKQKGHSDARLFDNVTVIFTDFVDFTQTSERLNPTQLVAEIHTYFKAFDAITAKYGLEKIKTIGDAYLAVAGLPHPEPDHALRAVKAALEFQAFTREHLNSGGPFRLRVGLNSGPLVAGIVGVKKFAYDIWGDTVNTASRMESSCEPGRINVSESTYALIRDHIPCEYRGALDVKGKGALPMYFVMESGAKA